MPEGYGIGVDLHQFDPAAFTNGEDQLDGTPDEPAPPAFGTAAGNDFIGRKQYLADPLHVRAATVFLAAPARNPFVQAMEKPADYYRSNGYGRANNEMCVHTDSLYTKKS